MADGSNEGKAKTKGEYITLGAGIGVALGAGLGAAIDNIAIGVVIGIAVGPLVGLAFAHQQEKREKAE